MPDAARIRELNDRFRMTLVGGRTVMTPGIAARDDIAEIIEKVCTFDAFDPGNDPHQEHDFGAFKIGEQQIFWKLECYDLDLTSGSPDPGDAAVTCRVLTIMLAEDY